MKERNKPRVKHDEPLKVAQRGGGEGLGCTTDALYAVDYTEAPKEVVYAVLPKFEGLGVTTDRVEGPGN